MKEKLLTLIILMILSTSIIASGAINYEYDEKNLKLPNNEPIIDIGTIDLETNFTKKVWNETSEQWEENITATMGDIVRFNITIQNEGESLLYNISIKDILPDGLEYADNADPVETNVSGNGIYWNLTSIILQNGDNSSIEFDAKVVGYGTLINIANLTSNKCSTEGIYEEDDAIVFAESIPTFDKTVWNETSGQWEENITAEIGDIVRFNITAHYEGEYLLYNINITDILPEGLEYADNADPVESNISDDKIFWNLTDIILEDGDSYSIEFDAEVIDYGTNINLANMITNECSGEIWEYEDTAIVFAEPIPTFDKTVWNETSGQWEENITAEIGDIVRFNITAHYEGEYLLYNINITDTLPEGLEYADNADPVESNISDDKIFWNLTDIILEDGDSYSIEFDAEVIDYGTNINLANMIANECSGEIWEYEDTAKVYVKFEPEPFFDKKVWNETSGQWEENITAEIDEKVRFKITITYYGPTILFNMTVTDTLPEGLEYANNAEPAETSIEGKSIIWDLGVTILENGESYSIEFDAKIKDEGININIANITAEECVDIIHDTNDTAIVDGIAITDPLISNAGGPYEGYTDDIIEFTGSATGGTSPYTYEWDLDNDGEYDDYTGTDAEKSWDEAGTYTIRLKVTDDKDRNDTDSAQVIVTVENTKPNKPSRPTGETEGRRGDEYIYSTSTTDPQDDQVSYLWDFGDGTNSGWIGPYNSGETIEINHIWDERGDYEIKVRAKDTSGLLSDWSDPLSISMPRYKIFNPINQIIQRIMGNYPILEKIFSLFFNF